MNDHHTYLKLAFEQARVAGETGQYPYGAIIVLDGSVIAAAHNLTRRSRDLVDHAEMLAIRAVARAHSENSLRRATLYASCEPCPMCAAALYWSGIGRLVYACPTEVDALISDMPFAVPCRTILTVNNGHQVKIIGALLQAEAESILRRYWSELRLEERNIGLAR
jgi:tRNA(Arg) A34 adenosine deaminase TadA